MCITYIPVVIWSNKDCNSSFTFYYSWTKSEEASLYIRLEVSLNYQLIGFFLKWWRKTTNIKPCLGWNVCLFKYILPLEGQQAERYEMICFSNHSPHPGELSLGQSLRIGLNSINNKMPVVMSHQSAYILVIIIAHFLCF